LFVGFVGWLWIAAVLCMIYLLASAILFSGSWWLFFACAVAAWLLYRVALYRMKFGAIQPSQAH
jgi:hypothetical protein